MTTCEGKTRSRPGSWIKSWCCWPVPALSIIKQWQRQPGPVLIYVVSSEIWARSNGPYTQQLKQQQFYPSESFEICCPYKDSVAKLDAVTKKKWYICVWNVDALLDFFCSSSYNCAFKVAMLQLVISHLIRNWVRTLVRTFARSMKLLLYQMEID